MKARVVAALAAALLTLSAARAAETLPPPNTDSPALGAIESDYVAEYVRDEPTTATYLGFHDGDDRLPDLSAPGYAARIARSKRYLTRLAALDSATLSPEDAADVAILQTTLQRELLADETQQRWRHDPAAYTHAASYAISVLFARGFAPIDMRLRRAVAREEAIPGMLEAGLDNINTVDAATATRATRAMFTAVDFFRNDVPAAFASVNDTGLQARFKAANDAVIAALIRYSDAMNAGPLAHPSGTFAIGADAFAKELALVEGRPIALSAYERAGEAALAQTRDAFIATAKAIDPARTPAEVYAAIRRDHPDADGLMPEAERQLADLRAFVLAKHLVTTEFDTNVLVRETPQFDRQTAFASLSGPGAFEKVSTQAYYFVTPVDPAWTAEQKEQHLEFFNYAAFPVIVADDVMPGGYVNLASRGRGRLSLVREISNSPTYTDGWANYSEGLLVETGLDNGDPRVKLASLARTLEHECRYLVGLREHTQGMTVERAAAFFTDNAYLSPADAREEALLGTGDPFYGRHVLGKLEILKLRDDYEKKMGAAYRLEAFNDAVLAHGRPPIGVLRTLLLGNDDDGALL